MLTKPNLLKIRSLALKKARDFFYAHGYLEVDCPILSPFAALDSHIDLLKTDTDPPLYLHSSPEYGMKKLLSQKAPSIFQLSHVFRSNESSLKHTPEFTLAEFYKIGIHFSDFIEETLDFIQLFTGPRKVIFYTYRQAFLTHLGLDPFKQIDLIEKKVKKETGLDSLSLSSDAILHAATALLIEPSFAKEALTVMTDFPASMAALAEESVDSDLNPIGKRFEVYCEGLELANGYKELKDPSILKKRFDIANSLRTQESKSAYPIDTELLEAQSHFFPDCSGVACGFDRLLMIQMNACDIKQVQAL